MSARRILAGVAVSCASIALAGTAEAASITTSQLTRVSASGQCTIRPQEGAAIYAAITSARTQSAGLSDAQVLQHASSRLGYGPSPHGPLTVPAANDCTTVFVSDEIARQIASMGAVADTPQVTRIRRAAAPQTMFLRADLNQSVVRQQNDPEGVALQSFGTYWYEGRRQLSYLKLLRELVGSQSLGTQLVDTQLNINELTLELWLNHFNVNTEKATLYYYGSDGYPEVLRSKHGGTFEGLLGAVLAHPGMLYYLDNKDSYCDPITGAASNQNLARELLELHTLGVGPNAGVYTQADVTAMASALCGWNALPYSTVLPAGATGFVYNGTLAHPGTLRVLNVDYLPSPSRVTTILKALATHASTRSNVCGKLSRRLYAPTLTTAASAACVSSWGTSGNLKAMLTALVQRADFWKKANYRTLLRTPIDLAASIARQQGASLLDIDTAAGGATEAPFAPATVTPQQVIDNTTVLRGSRAFLFLQGVMKPTNTMLGMIRTEVGPPKGYPMDGSAYLSSAYIDDMSRMGLDVGSAFEQLIPTARADVGSPAARTALDAQITSTTSAKAAIWFIEGQLKLGDVIGGTTASPFQVQPSQWTAIQAVFASQPSWAYHVVSTTSKRSHSTLLGLGLGSVWMMWR